ncbi:unnamed protein product [Bathycoccus prasinos]
MNTSRDVGLIKVPGLGLERRDFSIDKKRTNNMAKWGEGAKRLEFELRPVHSSCEYRFSGNTSDLVSVRQIIILNAGKEVPYVALLEQLFPKNLKFQEQAQLMYETSMLVSVHTAGFYNVLFMQSGSIAIQINVAGTHFGTIEYEHRPQEPFWIRGMWQTPVERICSHRAVIFLELWAEPDPLHSKKFVGHKKMGHEIALEYKKWASTNIEDFEDKWKLCGRDDAFFDCFDGIANEMRAHSTADTLFIKPSKFMSLIHPYIPCVEKGYCKQ